ncbi:YcxB family protein [Pseudomonas sp. Gutcm_11s]|uniref:YcxB family protein n=1 Tax=Pseudomonas sp. Gutcm_11s TaxID=3026088 RepID=UPI00235FD946|nr:YcxB family protein [Pseudomonas sp. Gutcm_11s]MDD0841249.1 YcxB family protein [Pseudomonas sp. Gutcm_11s]
MRIDLQYWIGPREYLAREYLLSRDPIRAVFAGYRRETLEYLVLCLFAGFVAWHTQEVVFVFIALCFIGYKVAWFFQVRREFPKAFEAQIQKLAPREIQLTIDDDGLHETVEGVKSFAPWAAVTSHIQFRDTYFLQLAGGLMAIIPCSAVAKVSPPGEDALISVLTAKQIPPRPASP